MKKRILSTILAGVMLLSSCGSSTSSTSSNNKRELTMFLTSPEYAEAMQTLIDEYENVNPDVKIYYETTQDYNAMLRTKINAGEIPDFFHTSTGKEIQVYADYSYDLTNEPLVLAMDETVKEMNSFNGQVLGLPIKNNVYGIVYDVDILEEVGYNNFPRTISEFEQLCIDLQSAGYQPITTGYAEWWVFKHIFQHYVNAAAIEANITTAELVDMFLNGEANIKDYPELYNDFFHFLDLTIQYGDSKPLEVDLNGEITNIAIKNSPIVVGQGPWIEADVLKINEDANLALAPYPINDDPSLAQIIKGPDLTIRINKDSENIEDAVDFANWWFTSDYGQNWFFEIANVMPPVTNVPSPEFNIVQTGEQDIETNGAGTLANSYSTDSFHQTFGELIQAYLGGSLTKDELCTQIEARWQELG